MTKGLSRSVSRGKPLLKGVIKRTIPFAALALSVSGVTGNGWATAAIPAGSLPEGNILILGAVADVTFTTADAGVTATWTGNYAIGTGATADATLSGTEVNVVPSTVLAAATAKVSPTTRGAGATASIIDNTDKGAALNLNLEVDDATISSVAPFTATGWVTIAFVVLGDD